MEIDRLKRKGSYGFGNENEACTAPSLCTETILVSLHTVTTENQNQGVGAAASVRLCLVSLVHHRLPHIKSNMAARKHVSMRRLEPTFAVEAGKMAMVLGMRHPQ